MLTAPVVLVTVAARRIGRAVAGDLAAAGFPVVIHCNRSRGEADELAATIGAAGGRAAVVQGDLTDMAVAEGLIAEAARPFGPIGLLVNNASAFEPDSAQEFSWEVWERHFALHLKAPVMLTRQFAAALPAPAEGLAVNIVDQRVWRPTPRYFSYSLSKSALWDATRIMAQAHAPRVRVNAIGPGPTLANTRQRPEDFAAQAQSVLLGRGPALGEFGATIRYLWEAKSVTGQMIAIDGGQHLAWQTPDTTGIE